MKVLLTMSLVVDESAISIHSLYGSGCGNKFHIHSTDDQLTLSLSFDKNALFI